MNYREYYTDIDLEILKEELSLEAKKKTTPEIDDKIKDMYVNQNINSNEIASKLGLGHSTILRTLKRLGIDRNKFVNIVTPEIAEKIKSYYLDQKLSTLKIGKMLGMNEVTVWKALKSMGVPIRQYSNIITPEIQSQIIDMYVNQRIGTATIAKRFNLSGNGVLDLLRRLGINRRPQITKITSDMAEEIKDMYVNKKMSLQQIGSKFGVSSGPIYKLLKKMGVRIRSKAESQELKLLRRNKDNHRKNHNTRHITGKGNAGTQYFAGGSDNVGSSKPVDKKQGGNQPPEGDWWPTIE